jgi:hypothetical protein
MRTWTVALMLLLAAGCLGRGETPEEPAQPAPPPALPAGFLVVGEPVVEQPFLPPPAAWRAVLSRLTTLRADAISKDEDLLVTFDEGALHATTRGGARRTWVLPEGLRLSGAPAHLVLGADGSLTGYRADGAQLPARGEVTLVTARLAANGGAPRQFRLVVKEGRVFRSISTPGEGA